MTTPTGFRLIPISTEPLDPASDCIEGFGGAPAPGPRPCLVCGGERVLRLSEYGFRSLVPCETCAPEEHYARPLGVDPEAADRGVAHCIHAVRDRNECGVHRGLVSPCGCECHVTAEVEQRLCKRVASLELLVMLAADYLARVRKSTETCAECNGTLRRHIAGWRSIACSCRNGKQAVAPTSAELELAERQLRHVLAEVK